MVDLTITIRYLSIFLSIAVSPLIMPEYALAIPFQDSKEIKAGPIYSNRDARKKCPGICLRADATWTGKWHRVSSGVMSACQCAIDNTVSDNSTCTLDEICKSFRIINEYNNNATKEGGLCWKWLKHSHCALGIPREALLFYEIEIKGGKAYYKLDNKPFNSWFGGHKETLYIINARNNKIYFINVDGRYIEARGTANCIEQKVKEGQSTIECKIPRLTTHAGILLDSEKAIADLIRKNNRSQPLDISEEIVLKIIGAGTIHVIEGYVVNITNDSGHFGPSVENLKASIKFLAKKGINGFPDGEICDYSFEKVKDKTGNIKPNVYSQKNSFCQSEK